MAYPTGGYQSALYETVTRGMGGAAGAGTMGAPPCRAIGRAGAS